MLSQILVVAISISATADADPFPTPFEDPRCGEFGYDFAATMPLIPVAWPIIQDLTPRGDLAGPTGQLAAVLARDLEVSGVFDVLSPDVRPSPAWWTWMDEVTFDYLGWRDAGAYLVLVGEMSSAPGGALAVRMTTYLTEEGDTLRVAGAEAMLPADQVEAFAHQYVSALLHCITGRPGVFGTRIAFSHRLAPEAPKEVSFTEFGSVSPVRVSAVGTFAILPAWGPGGALAFTGYRSGNWDLYVVERAGQPDSSIRVVSSRPGLNTGAAYSPVTGTLAVTLALEGNMDIYLLDPQTGETLTRMTYHPGVDSSPTWSPDGRQIAFVSDRFGGPTVFLMESDGSAQRPLPLGGSYNTSPDWSPDGSCIAYQRRGEGGRFSIWRYDFDSGAAVNLTYGPWDDEEPSFAPDGRLIVFTSTRQGQKSLFVMTRDGRRVRPLDLGPGEFFTPAWERPFNGPARARGVLQ